jgi:hypothetical protein
MTIQLVSRLKKGHVRQLPYFTCGIIDSFPSLNWMTYVLRGIHTCVGRKVTFFTRNFLYNIATNLRKFGGRCTQLLSDSHVNQMKIETKM